MQPAGIQSLPGHWRWQTAGPCPRASLATSKHHNHLIVLVEITSGCLRQEKVSYQYMVPADELAL